MLSLVGSTVGVELAAEIEAIGREFQKEADDISARMQAVAYQLCYPAPPAQQQGDILPAKILVT